MNDTDSTFEARSGRSHKPRRILAIVFQHSRTARDACRLLGEELTRAFLAFIEAGHDVEHRLP